MLQVHAWMDAATLRLVMGALTSDFGRHMSACFPMHASMRYRHGTCGEQGLCSQPHAHGGSQVGRQNSGWDHLFSSASYSASAAETSACRLPSPAQAMRRISLRRRSRAAAARLGSAALMGPAAPLSRCALSWGGMRERKLSEACHPRQGSTAHLSRLPRPIAGPRHPQGPCSPL